MERKKMQTITLTNGMTTIVDDDVYEMLNEKTWYARKRGNAWYAYRHEYSKNTYKYVFMHRVIANTPEGLVTDHISGDGLDNRRENLRVCTHAENMHNYTKPSHGKTSRFKGVFFNKQAKKYHAIIRINNKVIHVGYFKDEILAASAYNEAAVKYHGVFAKLNDLMPTVSGKIS
jgi:hypothetical protein